jgi:beta-lactamase class A
MRRTAFLGGAVSSIFFASAGGPVLADSGLGGLEAHAGGRLGVAAVDLGSGATLVHRPDERFPMCSTFKFLAVSAVLAKVDRGREHLDRHVAYSRTDLVGHSPVTEKHVAEGFLPLGTLCEAAMTQSDNGAANLILRSLHGPGGVTRYARSIGDAKTRLDRMEPELNDSVPGDARDTTTPRSMATNLRRIVLGSALSPAAQGRLQTWMLASQTGPTLLRAGVPSTWRVADKSGMGGAHNAHGDSDTRNDIALLWATKRAPIVVAAYLTGSTLGATDRDAVLASVARFVRERFT